jgi:GTP-binding protein
MSLPVVAIVGRPNVGKSSLLNCLAGKRISIVDPTAGVTRDRVSAPVELTQDGYVEVVDTGGFLIPSPDLAPGDIAHQVNDQIDFAIAQAEVILFVVDAREGVTPLDTVMAQKLRRQAKPVILVANKVDAPNAKTELGELNALGFGEPLPVSAVARAGIEQLVNRAAELVGPLADRPAEPVMKMAIVGRRNVGKSTFINALAGQQRVIVSEIPGTTRDSVDVLIDIGGQTICAIDTAGLKKRTKFTNDIEYYSQHRSLRSVRRADVVLLLIDATEPIGLVDKQLAEVTADEFKPTVIVVNKWDLARGKAETDQYEDYLNKMLPSLTYAPIVFTSASEGAGLTDAVKTAQELFVQSTIRVGTTELNKAVADSIAQRSPKARGPGRPSKLYYVTQIATAPPTIVCFVNEVNSFDQPYQRFLLKELRARLPFAEIPIRVVFRPRKRDETRQRPMPPTAPGRPAH